MLNRRNLLGALGLGAFVAPTIKFENISAPILDLKTPEVIVPTGFSTIDNNIGGGVPAGSMMLFYGLNGTGKTSMLIQILNNNKGENCIVVDMDEFGGTGCIYHYNEGQYPKVEEFVNFDENALDKNIFNSFAEYRRKLMRQWLKKAQETNKALFIATTLREKPEIFCHHEEEKLVGGFSILYHASYAYHLKKMGKTFESPTKCTMIKNRYSLKKHEFLIKCWGFSCREISSHRQNSDV